MHAGGTDGAPGAGAYVHDAFGRQTLVPAADTPGGASDLTLSYYDSDLARSITSGGTTTTYALDAAYRRQTATTVAGATTTTTTHHYSDGSDNPAWTTSVTTGQPAVTQWNTEDLSGGLGALIAPDGAMSLNLADPHGDIATTGRPTGQPGRDQRMRGDHGVGRLRPVRQPQARHHPQHRRQRVRASRL